MIGSKIDDWLNIARREAGLVLGQQKPKSTLVVTSYDKQTYSVKGILMPAQVETGWIPIGSPHIGNGYGIAIGPKCGSAEALDGDQFEVDFENGDPNWPIARHRLFSDQDQPPQVESGEMLVQHASGNKLFFDQNNNMTFAHHAGATLVFHDDKSMVLQHAAGTSISWDAEGNITHDAKNMSISIAASQGGSINLGQGAQAVNVVAPAILAAGSTLAGQGIQTV